MMKELATALCKAQAQITGAVKDSTNPHYKSKYADLESVWDACRVALTSNGLSVAQFGADAPPGYIAITTMLLHESGESLQGTMTLPMVKNDPQAAGSAITYARRYSLAAMVGVVQVDDDAQEATTPKQKPPSKPPVPPGKAKLNAYREAQGWTVEQLDEHAHANYGRGLKDLTDAEMGALVPE